MHCLNKNIGRYGEDIAERYLKNLGYVILNRNFSCKLGEIDLIGKDKDYICFIEVKTRYNSTYGYPSESVTTKKQFKIYKTAEVYILKNKLFNCNFRFDVVEILLNLNENDPHIRLIKNAFQL